MNIRGLLLLAIALGRLFLGSRAIVEIGAVCRNNWVLGVEEELSLGYSCSPHACPDGQPVVILGVAVEISAMPIMTRLWRHGDLNVDVIALTRFVPSVDLHRHTQRQGQVNDVELFSLTPTLQLLSIAVVSGLNWRICVTPLRWEALKDGLAVPSRRERRYSQPMILQEGTTDGDFFGHAQAMGDWGGEVPPLNVDGLTLYNPILAL